MSDDAGSLVTTISGKDVGLAALLRTLESLGKQVDSSLTQAGNRIGQAIGAGAGRATPALQGLSVSAERASRDALALASTYARGQAGAGDYAGAIQRLNAALEAQSVVNVKQAAQIRNQIAGYERAAVSARTAGTAISELSNAAGSLGLVLAVPAAIAGASALAQEGAQADQTRIRFDQLAQQSGTTGQALLNALRGASAGTVSDFNLQLAAVKANMLGVASSADDLAILLQIARDRAQQFGLTTEEAFTRLVEGAGKGSPEILNDLGIIVKADEAYRNYAKTLGTTAEALTAAQRQQAIIATVIDQGRASLEASGGAASTAASQFERLGATLINLKNAAGGGLAKALEGPVTGLNRVLGVYTGDITALTELNQLFGQSLGEAGSQAEIQSAAILAFSQAVAEGKNPIEALTAGADAMGEAIASSAIESRNAGVAAEDAADPTERFGKALGGVAAAGPLSATGSFAAAGGMDAVTASATEAANATARLLGLMGGVNDRRGSIGGANTARSGGLTGFLGGASAAAADAARIADIRRTFGLRDSSPTRGGGGGGRTSTAAREQAALLRGQEDFANKSLDAEREYQDELAKLAEEGARERLEAQNKYDLDRVRSKADFYKSLAGFENQDLARDLSARYEQAAQQAQEIAKTKGADAAQAYLQAQRDAIQSQGDLQNEIDKADKEGDKGKAEYYRGLLKLQQDADAEQLRQIEAQGSQVAASENAQYLAAEQRYAEHLERMGLAYERKFGAAPTGIAPPPPATTGAGSASATAGPAGAGTTTGAAGAGAGQAQLVSDPGTQAAVDAGLGRIEGKLDALATAVGAVEKRTGDVERAVRDLKSRGVTGGG